MKKKEKSLKKIKYWDSLFIPVWAFIFFVIFAILLGLLGFDNALENEIAEVIIFIIVFALLISIMFIGWGMLYHMIKNDKVPWIIVFVLLFVVGLAPVVSMIFYWKVMRKEFMRGGGVYD